MGGGNDNLSPTGNDNLPPSVTLSSSSLRLIGLLNQPEPDRNLEFHERDIIWPSDLDPDPDSEPESETAANNPHKAHKRKNSGFGLSAVFAEDRVLAVRRSIRPVILSGPDTVAKSAPVNVPTWHVRRRSDHLMDELEEKEMDEEEVDDEEMVPPHVVVSRSHVTTFLVFEGVGSRDGTRIVKVGGPERTRIVKVGGAGEQTFGLGGAT